LGFENVLRLAGSAILPGISYQRSKNLPACASLQFGSGRQPLLPSIYDVFRPNTPISLTVDYMRIKNCLQLFPNTAKTVQLSCQNRAKARAVQRLQICSTHRIKAIRALRG
jgi:hypothetical protein